MSDLNSAINGPRSPGYGTDRATRSEFVRIKAGSSSSAPSRLCRAMRKMRHDVKLFRCRQTVYINEKPATGEPWLRQKNGPFAGAESRCGSRIDASAPAAAGYDIQFGIQSEDKRRFQSLSGAGEQVMLVLSAIQDLTQLDEI